MPITYVRKDPEALTMTVVADFAAPLQRLWDAYADPRQLERFWGPPSHPATFTRHDMFPGGRSAYAMIGPDGDVSRGYWEFLDVKAPYSFEVRDGFAHPDGTPNNEHAVDAHDVRLRGHRRRFPASPRPRSSTALAELEQLLGMGMEEGMRQAMGQIDDVLADLRPFAADLPAAAQVLDDTQVRVSRVIRGTVEQVWDAHHDPDLLPRWLLGPDGWSMPTCEVATEVGQTYRYGWREDDSGSDLRLDRRAARDRRPAPRGHHRADVRRRHPRRRPRHGQRADAHPGGRRHAALASSSPTPTPQTRDIVLGTGMVGGMETSYERLERTVLAG